PWLDAYATGPHDESWTRDTQTQSERDTKAKPRVPRTIRPQTAEGALIRMARRRMSPRLSIAQAAQHACISPEHWGNIERGHQSQGGGQSRIIIPPADTLAHVASAVGVRPRARAAVRRQGGARLLREIIARRRPGASAAVVTEEPQRLQLANWFTAE